MELEGGRGMSDRTISEYMILTGVSAGEDDAADSLNRAVFEVMEMDYWQPWGNPWGDEKQMWQAMVKYGW